MSININTNIYTGPMDMLLNLIEKNKIDIYDIKISDITDHYLAELETMKNSINPDEITEFVYMASLLLELKSKSLLPKNEYIDEEEEITEEILMERLLEYKKFKVLSMELREMSNDSLLYFSKVQEDLSAFIMEEPKNEIIKDTNILLDTFINIFKKNIEMEKKFLDSDILKADEYSVDDYMENIESKLQKGRKYTIKDLIEDKGSKSEIIVIFLSVLELIKTRVVKVIQENNYNNIYVELR